MLPMQEFALDYFERLVKIDPNLDISLEVRPEQPRPMTLPNTKMKKSNHTKETKTPHNNNGDHQITASKKTNQIDDLSNHQKSVETLKLEDDRFILVFKAFESSHRNR